MFRKIKYRLLFYFLLLALLPLSLTMYWFYESSTHALRQRTNDQLKGVREIKKKEIESYINIIRQQAVFFAGGNITLNALKDFTAAFQGIRPGDFPAEYPDLLRAYYQNEFLGQLRLIHPDTFNVERLYPKDKRSVALQTEYLVSNKTASRPRAYSNVHDKYNTVFSTFMKANGFYDVMLIEDETGYIVYSVDKEIDFATSLLSDAHADSNLGKLFRKVRYSGLKYQAAMSDFETYLPSGLAPTAFIAAPIYDKEKKIGTLVFQVPIDAINAITTSNKEWKQEGLGETGETYIVGADCKMRTDSRFIIESVDKFFDQTRNTLPDGPEKKMIAFYKTTVLFLTVCNESVNYALANQSSTRLINDYRGRRVLSSSTPLDVPDVRWVFLAEIDESEALLPVKDFERTFSLIFLTVISLVVLVALFVAHTLSKPIRLLVRSTKELGEGNLNVQVKVVGHDELSVLEKAFNQTVDSLREQRTILLEKNEEITIQSEQISLVNRALQEKNTELDHQKEEILVKKVIVEQQKEEITAQADNLMQLNNEISEINSNLEIIVRERTQKLEEQNKKLADYAFVNAHKLRGPLSRIMGLLNIIHLSDSVDEKLHYISLLQEAGRQLDDVVHTIQKLIEEEKEITKE